MPDQIPNVPHGTCTATVLHEIPCTPNIDKEVSNSAGGGYCPHLLEVGAQLLQGHGVLGDALRGLLQGECALRALRLLAVGRGLVAGVALLDVSQRRLNRLNQVLEALYQRLHRLLPACSRRTEMSVNLLLAHPGLLGFRLKP